MTDNTTITSTPDTSPYWLIAGLVLGAASIGCFTQVSGARATCRWLADNADRVAAIAVSAVGLARSVGEEPVSNAPGQINRTH